MGKLQEKADSIYELILPPLKDTYGYFIMMIVTPEEGEEDINDDGDVRILHTIRYSMPKETADDMLRYIRRCGDTFDASIPKSVQHHFEQFEYANLSPVQTCDNIAEYLYAESVLGYVVIVGVGAEAYIRSKGNMKQAMEFISSNSTVQSSMPVE